MLDLTRRRFLSISTASVAACGAAESPVVVLDSAAEDTGEPYSAALDGPYQASDVFPAGVASGDPTSDAVILWTRLSPTLDDGAGVSVTVEVARDRAFTEVVWAGEATAEVGSDHTVAFDVKGLDPGTTWYYRFVAGAETSPPGRTRTAPDEDATPERVRVAWFSCQKWTHGYFTGHHDLSWQAADPATDVDVVICVGDYVYDRSSNENPRLNADGVYSTILVESRNDEPIDQAVTLDEFRLKYKHYRSDLNLQAMHANFPVVAVYDNHDGNSPGDRKREGATGAFFEYMPIRRFPDDPERIHRRFRWSSLLELWMCDQQSFQNMGDDVPEEEATLLGLEQRAWLLDGIVDSDARWRMVGSQKVFSRFLVTPTFDLGISAFDKVPGERSAILRRLADEGVSDVILVSGDAHVFLAAELVELDDPEAPVVGIELSAGLTSSNFDQRGVGPSADTWSSIGEFNPHVVYAQLDLNGYGIVDLTAEGAVCSFRQPLTITEPVSETRDLAVVELRDGVLVQTGGAPPDEAG